MLKSNMMHLSLLLIISCAVAYSSENISEGIKIKYDIRHSFMYIDKKILKRNVLYPYGGFIDSTKRQVVRDQRHNNTIIFKAPNLLIFKNPVYYNNTEISNSIDFSNSHFYNAVDFSNTYFTSIADFHHSRYDSTCNYSYALFDSLVGFYETIFKNALFNDVFFTNGVNFSSSYFINPAYFKSSYFAQESDFKNTLFTNKSYFNNASFFSFADFTSSKYDSFVDFEGACFYKGVSFKSCIFNDKVNLDKAIIIDSIDMLKTVFKKGLDLRSTRIDSFCKIFMNNFTYYPKGKLYINWEDIKGKLVFLPDDIILKTDIRYNYVKDRRYFNQMADFYKGISENYILQGDINSSRAVNYEISYQRALILQEWHWILYGWFMEWGFKPIRLIYFLILPVIMLLTVIRFQLYNYPLRIVILNIIKIFNYCNILLWKNYFGKKDNNIITDQYQLITNDGVKPIRLTEKYNVLRENNENIIYYDERYSEVWQGKRRINITFNQKIIFGLLLKNGDKITKYSELQQYIKSKKYNRGKRSVNRYICDINKIAGWNPDEVIESKEKEGYRINKDVIYYYIIDHKKERKKDDIVFTVEHID